MNLSDLVELFGAAAPWLASLVVLVLACVIIVAFLQGREISIWPPQIGPHPRAWLSPPDQHTPADRPTVTGAPMAVVDREYAVDRARDFYQEIAPYYDLRNSGNLVSTHLSTVARLQAIRARRSPLRVLDIGGGTGKLIAIHFFNDDAISWTYVDSCRAMAEEFRRNLAGHPLGTNSKVEVDDFTQAIQRLPSASYDVVVLSLVLSSMPTLPDFAPIARLLTGGGSLIVTDINPGYTHANPLYKVAVEGSVVALRTTPVDPLEVIRRAEAAGLRATEQKPLGDSTPYYSFLTVFTPVAVHPTDEETRSGMTRV
ncbi:MAG: class I SAM-dependent methyltransferase [Actinobacteria bacterium]|nr:class I SAM-dependent methyltransferase [Actinomycetota bacterium]